MTLSTVRTLPSLQLSAGPYFFQSHLNVSFPVCLIVVSRDEQVDVALAPDNHPIDAAKTLVHNTCLPKSLQPKNDLFFLALSLEGQHHFPGDQFFARFCARNGCHGSKLLDVGELLFVTAERLKCYMDACKHTRRGIHTRHGITHIHIYFCTCNY